jgi:hypothetical protein
MGFCWCSIQLLLPTGTSPTESDGAGCIVLISHLLGSRFRRVYLGGARNWKLQTPSHSCRTVLEGEKLASTACCDEATSKVE